MNIINFINFWRLHFNLEKYKVREIIFKLRNSHASSAVRLECVCVHVAVNWCGKPVSSWAVSELCNLPQVCLSFVLFGRPCVSSCVSIGDSLSAIVPTPNPQQYMAKTRHSCRIFLHSLHCCHMLAGPNGCPPQGILFSPLS